MKLLLTSNGFRNTSLEKDFLEMTNSRTDLKVAIIHTASDPIEWVPESVGSENYIARLDSERKERNAEWLNSYKNEWTEKGYSVITVDLKESDTDKIKERLDNVDIIDVTGGDVNWLLDWAKKSKLDTYLKDLLEKGVVYVGTSAGSGLLNPDIGLTWWEPDMNSDHIGLGIIDFVVVPHQKEEDILKNEETLINRRKHLQSVINFPWKIYLLQDGQAIKVVDTKVEHIGDGTKRFV